MAVEEVAGACSMLRLSSMQDPPQWEDAASMMDAYMKDVGRLEVVEDDGAEGAGSLRTDLTTSFTPRLRVLFLAATGT